jgi:hypothetical protein
MLPTVTYGGNHEFWFDWLIRDALAHLIRCPNGSFTMPRDGRSHHNWGSVVKSRAIGLRESGEGMRLRI